MAAERSNHGSASANRPWRLQQTPTSWRLVARLGASTRPCTSHTPTRLRELEPCGVEFSLDDVDRVLTLVGRHRLPELLREARPPTLE